MSSSFFCRMGNKKYLLKKMIPLFPTDYDTFVDCFVGSGVVFLNLPDLENKKVVINDLEKDLIKGHRLLKKHTPTDKFEKYIEGVKQRTSKKNKTPFKESKSHFTKIYNEIKEGTSTEDKLMKLMITYCGGFSGNSVTNGIVYSLPFTKLKKSTMEHFKNKMKSVKSMTSVDYKRVINKYKNDPNAFIYLDPPYEKSKGLYDHYTIDFCKMADLLRDAKCRWFLSINDSPYIRECFKDFNIKETSVTNFSGNSLRKKTTPRKELFITNYSLTGKGVFEKEDEDSDAESCGCGCSGEGKSDEEDISVKLYVSPIKTKKYRAIWFDKDGEEIRHTDFGAKRYEDYTIHNDRVRKNRYIRRHKANEDWEDPYTAGALSRWVLWEKPDLKDSWNFYKQKFGFQ